MRCDQCREKVSAGLDREASPDDVDAAYDKLRDYVEQAVKREGLL